MTFGTVLNNLLSCTKIAHKLRATDTWKIFLSSLPNIEINSDLKIRVTEIAPGYSCVIIDDFLREPHALIEYAAQNADAFYAAERSYPGLLHNVDNQAMQYITRFIRTSMGKQFSFLRGGVETSTLLSMATLQPDELSNLQRLCHSDPRGRFDRRNFAGLVYLFENEELGGTGFYRWKEMELITQATALDLEDAQRALAFLQKHFPTYNAPACYMSGSNEIAELLVEVPARFNRFVFYSGDVPHSANISSPEHLSGDFRSGRLTLNCFASVRPR